MSFSVPQSLDVFVIHAEEDDYLIQRLVTHFQDRWYGNTQFEIKWLDSRKGDFVGQDFGKRIRSYIRKSRYFLIIITEKSWLSPWVNQEIGYAFCTSMKRCLVMVARDMGRDSFGFIHSNIHVQPFTYGEFEFDIIDNKLEKEYGGVTPKIKKEYVLDIV